MICDLTPWHPSYYNCSYEITLNSYITKSEIQEFTTQLEQYLKSIPSSRFFIKVNIDLDEFVLDYNEMEKYSNQ